MCLCGNIGLLKRVVNILHLLISIVFSEHETELSYFRLEDYIRYKANPHLAW